MYKWERIALAALICACLILVLVVVMDLYDVQMTLFEDGSFRITGCFPFYPCS